MRLAQAVLRGKRLAVERVDPPVGVREARVGARPFAGQARPDPVEPPDRHGLAQAALHALAQRDLALDHRDEWGHRFGARLEIGTLERQVVALHRHGEPPPGAAVGEERGIGEIDELADEGPRDRCRIKPPEACQLIGQIGLDRLPFGVEKAQIAGVVDGELKRSLAARPELKRVARGIDRPVSDPVLDQRLRPADPRAPQMKRLLRPEVQMIPDRLAIGAGKIAGEAGRKHQPMRRKRQHLGLGCGAHHDHIDLGRRPARQDRHRRVGGEHQPAVNAQIGPHRVGGRIVNGRGVDLDGKGIGRVARILDPRRAHDDRGRVGARHILDPCLEHRVRRHRDPFAIAGRPGHGLHRHRRTSQKDCQNRKDDRPCRTCREPCHGHLDCLHPFLVFHLADNSAARRHSGCHSSAAAMPPPIARIGETLHFEREKQKEGTGRWAKRSCGSSLG